MSREVRDLIRKMNLANPLWGAPRIQVTLPANIGEQIAEARKTHQRFGQFAVAFDQIRIRIGSAPVERAELQRLCAGLGIPSAFDVALITWRPDYDAFFHRQLCRRARHLYLFRSEYISDLDNVTVVETPQPGHATYLFAKPGNMNQFLAICARVTKEDIRQNRVATTVRAPNPCPVAL